MYELYFDFVLFNPISEGNNGYIMVTTNDGNQQREAVSYTIITTFYKYLMLRI